MPEIDRAKRGYSSSSHRRIFKGIAIFQQQKIVPRGQVRKKCEPRKYSTDSELIRKTQKLIRRNKKRRTKNGDKR